MDERKCSGRCTHCVGGCKPFGGHCDCGKLNDRPPATPNAVLAMLEKMEKI